MNFTRLLILVLSLTQFPSAFANEVIEIGNPNFRPYPIAITEMRAMTKTDKTRKIAQTITEVLRFDFDLVATFKVLDPKSFIANPKKEGVTATTIRFENWINIGAEGLIKGTILIDSNQIKAELRAFDATRGRVQLAKSYTGRLDSARNIAHDFADALIEKLTGTPGFFKSKIVAVRRTKTGRELEIMDVDGSNTRRLTNNGSFNLLPSWRKDGKGVLYTSLLNGFSFTYELDLSSGKSKAISKKPGLNTGAVMSPDGKKIALTLTKDGNSEIYVMNSSGGGYKRLTNHWAIDSTPTWSPDSKRIAFVSSRWGDPHIFVINPDGSGLRRLTDKGNYNTTPEWSPRGDAIVFTARDERYVFDIFTVNPDTKKIIRLTQDQGHNEEPSFSPDGSHLVFTSTRKGKSQVWIMASDGSNQRPITEKGGYTTPAWSPYLTQ